MNKSGVDDFNMSADEPGHAAHELAVAQDRVAERVAKAIHDIDIPVHARNAGQGDLVPGESNDPDRWVDNYAQGVAGKGERDLGEVRDAINGAFVNRYGETPREAYIRETTTERPALSRDEYIRETTRNVETMDLDRDR